MSAARSRLAFVINSLDGGGAERVFATVVDALHHTDPKLDISVVLLDATPDQHDLPSGVRRTVLAANGRMLSSIRKLFTCLRRDKPDLVVSFLARSNCAAVLSGKILGIPRLIRESNHTSAKYGDGFVGRLSRRIIKGIYPHADGVIAVSCGVRKDLIDNYAVSEEKITAIYNPIDIANIRRLANEPSIQDLPLSFFVGVGRLVPQKNFELLLRAYASSNTKHSLVLLGDGPERARLKRVAAELGIAKSVSFLGYVRNPYPIISRAHALISSSNYEGFPNVLVEALALSIPVVATDCDSGPSEILGQDMRQGRINKMTHAPWGILTPVGCIRSMTDAIREIQIPSVHGNYSRKAPDRASIFDKDQTIREYQQVIARFLLH